MTFSALIAAAFLAVSPPQTGVLGSDGITLIGARGALKFGATEAEALAYAGAVFPGAPTRAQETNCRNGVFSHADWPQGVRLTFQAGEFVGWSADRVLQGDYSTAAGLNFRDSVNRLRQGRGGFMLSTAVQGREFAYAGVWGRVLQPGGEATIDRMWSGLVCARR
ncbi:MAG: hypothetical protein EON89_05740 [Brevundimonas sp.]|nr:MAG: hypothetical protein EON89_05740 [Brevundimonas sp.]